MKYRAVDAGTEASPQRDVAANFPTRGKFQMVFVRFRHGPSRENRKSSTRNTIDALLAVMRQPESALASRCRNAASDQPSNVAGPVPVPFCMRRAHDQTHKDPKGCFPAARDPRPHHNCGTGTSATNKRAREHPLPDLVVFQFYAKEKETCTPRRRLCVRQRPSAPVMARNDDEYDYLFKGTFISRTSPPQH